MIPLKYESVDYQYLMLKTLRQPKDRIDLTAFYSKPRLQQKPSIGCGIIPLTNIQLKDAFYFDQQRFEDLIFDFSTEVKDEVICTQPLDDFNLKEIYTSSMLGVLDTMTMPYIQHMNIFDDISAFLHSELLSWCVSDGKIGLTTHEKRYESKYKDTNNLLANYGGALTGNLDDYIKGESLHTSIYNSSCDINKIYKETLLFSFDINMNENQSKHLIKEQDKLLVVAPVSIAIDENCSNPNSSLWLDILGSPKIKYLSNFIDCFLTPSDVLSNISYQDQEYWLVQPQPYPSPNKLYILAVHNKFLKRDFFRNLPNKIFLMEQRGTCSDRFEHSLVQDSVIERQDGWNTFFQDLSFDKFVLPVVDDSALCWLSHTRRLESPENEGDNDEIGAKIAYGCDAAVVFRFGEVAIDGSELSSHRRHRSGPSIDNSIDTYNPYLSMLYKFSLKTDVQALPLPLAIASVLYIRNDGISTDVTVGRLLDTRSPFRYIPFHAMTDEKHVSKDFNRNSSSLKSVCLLMCMLPSVVSNSASKYRKTSRRPRSCHWSLRVPQLKSDDSMLLVSADLSTDEMFPHMSNMLCTVNLESKFLDIVRSIAEADINVEFGHSESNIPPINVSNDNMNRMANTVNSAAPIIACVSSHPSVHVFAAPSSPLSTTLIPSQSLTATMLISGKVLGDHTIISSTGPKQTVYGNFGQAEMENARAPQSREGVEGQHRFEAIHTDDLCDEKYHVSKRARLEHHKPHPQPQPLSGVGTRLFVGLKDSTDTALVAEESGAYMPTKGTDLLTAASDFITNTGCTEIHMELPVSTTRPVSVLAETTRSTTQHINERSTCTVGSSATVPVSMSMSMSMSAVSGPDDVQFEVKNDDVSSLVASYLWSHTGLQPFTGPAPTSSERFNSLRQGGMDSSELGRSLPQESDELVTDLVDKRRKEALNMASSNVIGTDGTGVANPNASAHRTFPHIHILVSEEFLDQHSEVMRSLAGAGHGVTCLDCVLERPVDVIIDINTGVSLLPIQTLLDKSSLKTFVRSLTKLAYKFQTIWLLIDYHDTDFDADRNADNLQSKLNELVTSRIESAMLVQLYQALLEFPCQVIVRSVTNQILANLLMSILIHTADLTCAKHDTLIVDYASKSFLSAINNCPKVSMHCEFLQLFPTVNYYLAAEMLSRWSLREIPSLSVQSMKKALIYVTDDVITAFHALLRASIGLSSRHAVHAPRSSRLPSTAVVPGMMTVKKTNDRILHSSPSLNDSNKHPNLSLTRSCDSSEPYADSNTDVSLDNGQSRGVVHGVEGRAPSGVQPSFFDKRDNGRYHDREDSAAADGPFVKKTRYVEPRPLAFQYDLMRAEEDENRVVGYHGHVEGGREYYGGNVGEKILTARDSFCQPMECDDEGRSGPCEDNFRRGSASAWNQSSRADATNKGFQASSRDNADVWQCGQRGADRDAAFDTGYGYVSHRTLAAEQGVTHAAPHVLSNRVVHVPTSHTDSLTVRRDRVGEVRQETRPYVDESVSDHYFHGTQTSSRAYTRDSSTNEKHYDADAQLHTAQAMECVRPAYRAYEQSLTPRYEQAGGLVRRESPSAQHPSLPPQPQSRSGKITAQVGVGVEKSKSNSTSVPDEASLSRSSSKQSNRLAYSSVGAQDGQTVLIWKKK